MSTDIIRRTSMTRKFHAASVYCTIGCCFFIPFSSSLMGITAVAAFVFWMFSGHHQNHFSIIKNNPAALFALALFLLLTISIFYSTVPPLEALSVLKKYRELLFFVMALSVFHGDERGAETAESAFIAGCVVLMVLSYAMYFSILPTEKFGYSTVYHITHSFFMAILTYFCLQRVFFSKRYKYLWVAIALLATINLFYIAPGRTGMLVFIALALITFVQRLSLKSSLVAIAIACLLLAGLFVTSNNFASRIKLAITEIENYHPDAHKSRSSMGMRFDWWINSIELIKEKPVLGHGVGSFADIQSHLIEGTNTKSTDNPHNEYLLLGVQVGLTGAALFVALLVSLFLGSFNLAPAKRYLIQGVVIAMGSGCLMNSFLFDSHQGHFFAIISGLLYAQSNKTAGNILQHES